MPSTPRDLRLDPVEAIRTAVGRSLARVGAGLYGVACSGGPDSLALADAAIEVAGARNVVVVTIDHAMAPGSAEVAAAVVGWARARRPLCGARSDR
jgi:tRNA(Ile)-lysidine synthase